MSFIHLKQLFQICFGRKRSINLEHLTEIPTEFNLQSSCSC